MERQKLNNGYSQVSHIVVYSPVGHTILNPKKIANESRPRVSILRQMGNQCLSAPVTLGMTTGTRRGFYLSPRMPG